MPRPMIMTCLPPGVPRVSSTTTSSLRAAQQAQQEHWSSCESPSREPEPAPPPPAAKVAAAADFAVVKEQQDSNIPWFPAALTANNSLRALVGLQMDADDVSAAGAVEKDELAGAAAAAAAAAYDAAADAGSVSLYKKMYTVRVFFQQYCCLVFMRVLSRQPNLD